MTQAQAPLKLARAHLLRTIEHALATSSPVHHTYPRYTLDATPYRIPGKRGNHGVRVTWTENIPLSALPPEKAAQKKKTKR